MRIHFTSNDRPESIAKAVKKALTRSGHDIKLSKAKEVTAAMFGYRGWNDLLGQIGGAPRSPYDHELDSEAVAERESTYATRLSHHAAVPRGVALAVVRLIGPTARKSPLAAHPFSTVDDWEAAFLRVATTATASAASIERLDHKGDLGFILTPHPLPPSDDFRDGILSRMDRRVSMSVSEDGRRVSFSHHRKRDEGVIDIGGTRERSRATPAFGAYLQDRGLTSRFVADGQCDPLVMEVVSRLRPEALSLLASATEFSSRAYDIALSVPEHSAFRKLVAELPMLGAEIASIDHYETNGFDPPDEFARMGRKMLSSDDPLEAYVDMVETYASKHWEHIVFDRAAARAATRATARCFTIQGLGLMPWHVAFVALGPLKLAPSTSDQLNAAITFIERWTDVFRPGTAMAVGDFFQDFETVFGGDWRAILEADRKSGWHDKILNHGWHISETIGWKLALEIDGDLDVLSDGDFVSILSRVITPLAIRDRGPTAFCVVWDRWRDERPPFDPEEDYDAVRGFEALVSSGLVPEIKGCTTAVEALAVLGFDWEAELESLQDPRSIRA